MPIAPNVRPVWVMFVLAAAAVIAACGCSRTKHRVEADRDAYHVIAERNVDPRWCISDYQIEIDRRSRYYDVYDPDRPPMPPDDPGSHRYMQCVDGKQGWKHWYCNGTRRELENPAWHEMLAEYAEIDENGAVKLDVDSAVQLAYVHSPLNQRQLETLYLSALDVSAERFRLDTQFFGGYDARYSHNGSLIPAGLAYSPIFRRFIVTEAIEGAGVENNRVTAGRPFGADPALLARRRFASAGELLVGFANSFVFEFTGGDANLASSLANFSFIQPLLRGAGKDVALEQLTFEERKLLANLRAYGQFREGFYTQVAIGELGVTGPQRSGGGTNLQSYSGQGGVGGYLGLLQQLQQIRNSEDNLSLQLRTRDRLEALYEADSIGLVQVDQFRQSVEAERANLLSRRNSFDLALDHFKTDTLGLPPDLPIELDDSLVRQFQLVPREITEIQERIVQLQRRVAGMPDAPEVAVIRRTLDDASKLVEPVRNLIVGTLEDLARMDQVMPKRERIMTDEQRERFRHDRGRLGKMVADLQRDFDAATAELQRLRDELSEQSRRETETQLISWIADYLLLVQGAAVVPARARLETVTVDSLELDSDAALQIALANRLDFMNGRAALVDRWRWIQFNADALQSVLNVTASGDIRTARNNPVSFRAPTGSLRLGLEFDAPFTRLLERNAYRESLIEYQRSRRDFIQSRDSLHLGLRALLRQIEQLRQNLEIQRRAVTIAIRRVDQTQRSLNPPQHAPQPGSRGAINETTALYLLSAQTSLRETQNSFLNAWLSYYAARMRLYRELGIMQLDPEGRWVERPIDGSGHAAPAGIDDPAPEEVPLPPVIPVSWADLADGIPSEGVSVPVARREDGSWPVAPVPSTPASVGGADFPR